MRVHDCTECRRDPEDRRGRERGPDDAPQLILWRDPQHATDHERIADALDRATQDETDDEPDDPPVERAEEQPAQCDRYGGREGAKFRLLTKIEGQIDDVGI